MEEKYKIIETGDGSSTVHSSEYNEAMHNISGAYDEALLKHVYPSKILDAGLGTVNVLDVGFGLGYNVLALIAEASKVKPELKLNIVSLEKSESLTLAMESIKFGDGRDSIYQDIKDAYSNGRCEGNNYSVTVEMGDGREFIRKCDKIKFNAVFQDPFSPGKNPELWTVEVFRKIYDLIHDGGILTTYSRAPQVRMGLIEAGFIVGKGPTAGLKKEGTLAAKSKVIIPLTLDELEELKANVRSTPYHDYTFTDERDGILERRVIEMKEKRSKGYHQAHQG